MSVLAMRARGSPREATATPWGSDGIANRRLAIQSSAIDIIVGQLLFDWCSYRSIWSRQSRCSSPPPATYFGMCSELTNSRSFPMGWVVPCRCNGELSGYYPCHLTIRAQPTACTGYLQLDVEGTVLGIRGTMAYGATSSVYLFGQQLYMLPKTLTEAGTYIHTYMRYPCQNKVKYVMDWIHTQLGHEPTFSQKLGAPFPLNFCVFSSRRCSDAVYAHAHMALSVSKWL
ncbi:uncharacterized protein LOC125541517 isoform X3 [Triticum urartu]|uniref:uncharacterized protein LOC125541517 isoform X3 n=1 Tax=Triticum urartu TaxID=4572 RepID=UPI002042F11B|nr:uncharacterized protein LOC125541517 isoform X3 [Triticum urartu]